MKTKSAGEDDVTFVLNHMREHSLREMTATRQWSEAGLSLVVEIEQLKPHAILRHALFGPSGSPAAIFAVYRSSAVVGAFQTFSTDEWPSIAKPFIGYFNNAVRASLYLAGIRMCETNVLVTPDLNPRWFALMGVRPWGGPLPRGRNGELYQPMVWLPDWSAVDAAAAGASCGSANERAQASHV